MSRLEGGIFSRPRGKTGGIVFGAARTREGKLVTSRLLVQPSNPNTTGQQNQRTNFSAAIRAVRDIGSGIYQQDFNRAIAQLPGFQSLLSIIMSSQNNVGNISSPPAVNLGSLHAPDTFSVTANASAGGLDVTWSTEDGDNGDPSDEITLIGISGELNGDDRYIVVTDQSETRTDGSATLTFDGWDNETAFVAMYARRPATGNNPLLLSPLQWDQALTGP